MLVGLALALSLLNRPRRGVGFYRSAFYLPMVFSLAVTGLFWRVLYQPDGADQHAPRRRSAWSSRRAPWLADPNTALYAVILVAALWRQIGYVMVLYLAGLKGFDPALDEAAAVDGADPVAAVPARHDAPARSVQHRRLRGHRDRLAALVRHRLGDDPGRPVHTRPSC